MMELKHCRRRIEDQSVDGTDDMGYTYSIPDQLLYVMQPDLDSVNDAKLKIAEVIESK